MILLDGDNGGGNDAYSASQKISFEVNVLVSRVLCQFDPSR
jgi:hypothetical protein